MNVSDEFFAEAYNLLLVKVSPNRSCPMSRLDTEEYSHQ